MRPIKSRPETDGPQAFSASVDRRAGRKVGPFPLELRHSARLTFSNNYPPHRLERLRLGPMAWLMSACTVRVNRPAPDCAKYLASQAKERYGCRQRRRGERQCPASEAQIIPAPPCRKLLL